MDNEILVFLIVLLTGGTGLSIGALLMLVLSQRKTVVVASQGAATQTNLV